MQVVENGDILSGREVKLIKRCYEGVLPYKQKFRQSFYTTIMRTDPTTREMFRKSFLEYNSLPDSVVMMTNYADSLHLFIKEIKVAGLKHKTYGVHPKQFPLIKKAVILTFKEFMGDNFTEEMEIAWYKIIDFFNHYMELGWRKK